MSGQYTIRKANEADTGLLARTAVETFRTTFQGTCTDRDLEAFLESAYREENFREEIGRARSDYFLIESGGEAAGYAWVAETAPPECVRGPAPVELVRFYIRAPWQGQAAARLLMEHCLSHARALGYRTMFLGVWEHNVRAQRFYARYGFRRVGEHVFQVGTDPQIDWWLEASL
jgi:ribosomal protein S18 acetylase RimI-like enzyme